MNEYDFHRETEFELLCAYVRVPERFQPVVEPRFFNRAVELDVARAVAENRAKHPKDVIDEHTLVTLLKQNLSALKQRDRLSSCRKLAHKIFKHHFRNLDTLQDIARRWVTERRYRQWLVEAEKRVNQGDYESLAKLLAQTQAKSGQRESTILHTTEDFMKSSKLTFSIEGFLQNGAATMIGGLSGHGKTWVMLSIAKALLTGEPLFGFFKVAKKAKRVVYLIPESTLPPFKHRLERMGLLKYALNGKLLAHTMSAGPKPKLDDPQILAVAKRAHVFLDTAIRFGTGKENSAEDNQSGLATDIFTLLSAGAKTVVGAHHSAKKFDKESFMTLENVLRGTGDIGAVPATVWGVKQLDATKNILHIENVKARDFVDLPCKPFQVQGRPYIDLEGNFRMLKKPGTCGSLLYEQPKRGGAAPELREQKDRNLEAVRGMLAKDPKRRSKDIAKRLGVAEATVRGYKRQLALEANG